jgi:Ca2+-binding RTX toxin-like protein
VEAIVGTAGVDSINTTETTASVDAGGGADFISIWTSNGAVLPVNAGGGDDFIQIQIDSRAAPMDIALTLGAGRDTVKLYQTQRSITVTDFQTGAQGDVVDFRYVLDQWVNGWDSHSNPFKAGGYFRLVQIGADTVLQLDKHAFGQAGTWVDFMVFQNTTAGSFTAENFGVAPDGSPPQNLIIQGTAVGETLTDGYGNDELHGGAGDDTLIAGPGDDLLDGGDGRDWLKDESAGNDRLLGGAGDDILSVQASSVATGPTGRVAYLDGGTGNDQLSYIANTDSGATLVAIGGSGDDIISFGGTTKATVDAGAGSDRVYFNRSGATTITLGEGRDVAVAYLPTGQAASAGTHIIHFTDFEAGLAGDRLDLRSYIDFTGWNGQSDLEAGKYVRFEQTGADTTISIATAGNGAWNTTVVLDNVQLSTLTPFNLTGLHPNGAYDGVVQRFDSGVLTGNGGGGDDLLFAYFTGVTLNGGGGNDRLEGADSSDILNGDDGADILLGGGWTDQLFGGAGADLLVGGSGADRLTGGAGADRFEGTLADMAGDTILDLQAGDVIKITDADAAHFSLVRRGSSVTLSTGESLTLANNPHNDLQVVRGAGGGVTLALSGAPNLPFASFNADFNGDGMSDIAWREAGGTFATWNLGQTSGHLVVAPNAFVTPGIDNRWWLAAADDFNGDGKSDLLWRNVGGTFSIWTSTGTGFAPNAVVDSSVSPDWRLATTGDFNGDGKTDLIWRHATGAFTEWNSTGTGFQQNVYVQSGVDPSWSLAGVGDLNGDGRDDLIWRHVGGTFSVWESMGAGFMPNTVVDATVSPDWTLAAVADFNGDGKDDLLWRHEGGAFSEWRSNGAGFDKNVYVNGMVGADWTLESTGDFNGDGKADLMWRHDGGVFTIWTATASGFQMNTLVDSTIPANWALASSDNFIA